MTSLRLIAGLLAITLFTLALATTAPCHKYWQSVIVVAVIILSVVLIVTLGAYALGGNG